MEVEDQKQINRATTFAILKVTNSVTKTLSRIAVEASLGFDEHEEVFASLAEDIDLQIYMCAWGTNFNSL